MRRLAQATAVLAVALTVAAAGLPDPYPPTALVQSTAFLVWLRAGTPS